MTVYVVLCLRIKITVTQVVKCHTGVALNSFHGQFMYDIPLIAAYISLFFEPEHFGEYGKITFL